MRTALRIAALFVAVITIGLWFFGGFNLGRTTGVVSVERTGDDGRVSVVHETRFLPGADFLAAGIGLCAVLLAASRFARPAPNAVLRS